MPNTEYVRHVALGNSRSEGLGDGDDIMGLHGWTDRIAGQLAAADPGPR